MEAQRERAGAKATFGADEDVTETVALYQQIGGALARPQQFVGYETLTSPATIVAMVAGGRRVREAAAGDEVEVILDRTPGYAESGGQMGDTGTLVGRAGQGEILDTFYRGSKLIVHRVKVRQGGLREGEDVAVSIESPRRLGLRQHHTGTHLLHAALRKVLGTHVSQAGSLVAPDHLRFDFSHGGGVKDREIEQIEELVNEQVQANTPVTHREMDLKEALAAGAMALFGEKYGDRVRVVKIGEFSTELCGGTHLDATGQIGFFKVAEEGAVASGVRRIEAVWGARVPGARVTGGAAVTRALVKRSPAGRLIQEVAQAAGGRGGGRPDLAQAGAPDPSKLDGALALVHDWVGRQA